MTNSSVLVDQGEVGLPVSVFASVKLERQREEELDRFGRAVTQWPEVSSIESSFALGQVKRSNVLPRKG